MYNILLNMINKSKFLIFTDDVGKRVYSSMKPKSTSTLNNLNTFWLNYLCNTVTSLDEITSFRRCF